MFFDVTHAEYVGNYKIRRDFEDDSSGVAELSGNRQQGTVLSAFLDVEHGAPLWGNGEIGIAPEKLYELATRKALR